MNKEKQQNWVANSLILLGILGRLLPHPSNVTPMGAVSLVGGAKLGKFWRWTIPFIAFALSDFLLGIFYHVKPWSFETPFIYGSFAINILLGSTIKNSNCYVKLGVMSLIGSLQFFIISNLGVWMRGMFYAKTFSGLMQCYTMALPFLRNSLMGDLCWSFGLFLVIERSQVWIQKRSLSLC